jgi:excisionase family DNA binding protein
MEAITFEQLPQAVTRLYDKLESIEKLILAKNHPSQAEADQLLTIEEAATLAHLSKATLYGLVSRSEIPCMKKGKRLYFSKQELTQWIKSGRKKTATEIAGEVLAFNNRKAK